MASSSQRPGESGTVEDDDGDEGSGSFPELLSFAARAQALISELLIVSERIPPEFRDPRFDPVLFDLRCHSSLNCFFVRRLEKAYFDVPDDFESRINGNRELQALEDELRESCSAYLQTFFHLARGIVTYHEELFKYIGDLQDGLGVQYKLDKILANEYGLQFLTESLSFFGCLLLLMEHHISGFLREKLLVAHLRYAHCFDVPNLENICKLCRLHPFSRSQPGQVHSVPFMIAMHRPEELLARFSFPKQVVDAVIFCVRDGDLFGRLRHYPDPQHRTVALSAQAGCLYVLLLYSPEILHNSFVMREVVDRFFRDCWVCPIFSHFSVDLSVSWDAYREAKTALSSYLPLSSVRDRIQLNCTKVKELLSELDLVISDGILTKDYVFENSHHLLSLVRSCNVLMHWLLLHRSSIDKKLRDTIASILSAHQIGDEILLLVFLKTCQLEFEMKHLYLEILEGRDALWDESKSCASDRMREISHFFSGSWASSYKMKNESLEVWFGKLVLEVHSLDYLRAGNSGRKIYYVMSALKEVDQLHQVEENPQIRRSLAEVQRCLQDMLKALSVDNGTLSTFTAITDSTYAWSSIDKFIVLLKKKIEEDASAVLILHCFFLKFRPLLEVPVSRILQNKGSYVLTKSSYYTLEYVSRVRTMLNILPVMIFRIFNEDTSQNLQPFHLSSHIEIANIQDFIQLDKQFNLMEAVNKTSIFSQGMLLMSRNFLGLIDLDMENLLESQISNELSRQLEYKFKSFSISTIVGPEELEVSMRKLTTYVLSQQNVLECLQDLLHIHGNYIWDEAFSNFLKHSAQEEADGFLRRLQDSMITQQQLNDLSGSQTFLGRLLCQMLYLSNPSRSMFIEPMSGWFDSEGCELLGLHFVGQLESCVGAVGMASLDSLVYCAIKVNLENVFIGLRTLLDLKNLEELCKLDETLGPPTSLPLLGCSPYKPMLKIVSTSCEPWVESLATVGQLQLLRYMISLKLNSSHKVRDGQGTHPFGTIYMCKDSPPFLSRYMSFITISQLSHYVFDPHLGTLTCQMKKAVLDFSTVIIGLGTFLRQFDPKYMVEYLQYMGQYVRAAAESVVRATEPQKSAIDPASEVTKSTFWLMNFCKHMEIPKDVFDSCLPPSLFTVLQA